MTDAVADLLRDECVVYILVDVDTVEPRITGNKTRPLLEPNPVERWSEILSIGSTGTRNLHSILWMRVEKKILAL